jgi:hypothetical protein
MSSLKKAASGADFSISAAPPLFRPLPKFDVLGFVHHPLLIAVERPL